MAKLVVLRGDTIDRKIDLVQLPARIGRGPNNQVVLQDPMKGVSREHAEIRLVDGRYLLVDLGSENGIWVAGRRVAEIALEPNVIASIGPFRLMLAEEATVPDTEVVKQMQRPAAVAVPPAPRPAATQPAPRAPAAPRAAAARSGAPMNQRKLMIGGGVAALVVVGLVAALVLWPDTPPNDREAEAPPQVDVARPIADADLQVSHGLCKEAVQTLDLALQQVPDNPDLLRAKRRAELECVPKVEIGEPDLDVVTELRNAKQLFATRECRAVLLRVSNVLLYQPDNAEAEDLRKQAVSCPPLAAPKPTELRAQDKPPSEGGLAASPNELDRDYQARVKAMRARYDDAMIALSKGPTPGAIEALDDILRDTSPDYLDVAAKLVETKKAIAKVRQNEAAGLERKELFDDAIAKLNEAKAFDPSLSMFVENEISRIQKVKIAKGEEACKLASQDISYANKRSEAIENFRRALKLLPPDHPCYAVAKLQAGNPAK